MKARPDLSRRSRAEVSFSFPSFDRGTRKFIPMLRRALSTPRTRRRGISGLVLVIVLPTLLLASGFALEIALAYSIKQEMQQAAELAALAAAYELLDSDGLKPGTIVDPADNAANAQEVGQAYANANLNSGRVSWNESAIPDLVLVGFASDPLDVTMSPMPYEVARDANIAQINLERSRTKGNPIPLRLAPLIGMLPVDMTVTSRAVMDRRVYGFRPVMSSPAPVAPLAILASGRSDSWATQSQATPSFGTNDNYTVDMRTGFITNLPDGIPEITLQDDLAASPNEGNLGLLRIGPAIGAPNWFVHTWTQLDVGLTVDDLSEIGGQLALPDTGTLDILGLSQATDGMLKGIDPIRGKLRVFPLYASRSGADPAVTYALSGFVAAWVIDVQSSGTNHGLVVTIQPGLVRTANALYRSGQPLNKYIGKPYLVF